VAQTQTAAKEQGLQLDPLTAHDRRGRGLSIWLWPALAIAAIAVADQYGGTPAGVAAFGLSLAFGCLLAGRVLDRRQRGYAVVLAIALSGASVLILLGATPRIHRGWVGAERGPVDLRGRRVTPAMVDKLDLRGSSLAGAQLIRLDLTKESLAGATAPGAAFTGSRLDKVMMRGADLRGADLSGACLDHADLSGATLTGARVDGAHLDGVVLDPGAARTWLGRPAPRGQPCRPV
jgi:Pentapeptide repeats (8 copies)